MSIAQSESTIVREILIDAPASKIYAALTDPNQLTQWWGSDDQYRTAKMTADLRVGGRWRTTGTGKDGQNFAVEGEYRIVQPPHLLEFTWRHDWGGTDNVETVVRYDLIEENGSTLVRVTHSGFQSEESRDDHGRGWAQVLGWLKRYVATAAA
ncbi:MAG: SRPBCC domain-containing protein [Candidatus Eremiobacteraeota bacterium]|nr:SRPBCC domain-containing protein [Candidatus Eremiobacteraeota bacterium]